MNEPEPPPIVDAPTPRNPIGWIVLAVLFAYLIVGATERSTTESIESKKARYTNELGAAVAAGQVAANPIGRMITGQSSPKALLKKLERESAPHRREDPIEAVVWVTVRRRLGEKVEAADLAPLRRSPENAIYAEAYSGQKRSTSEAQALVARLEARGPVSRIAADYVRREAGLPKSLDKALALRSIVGFVFVVLLFFASAAAWLAALALGTSGTLNSIGPATTVRTEGDADALALRAAILFTAFNAASIVASLCVRAGLDSRAAQGLVYGGMLFAVPKILGGRAGMARVGLSLERFGPNVLLGLWAFLLELPVTLLVGLLGSTLLKNLPMPTHPASSALTGSPDAWTIVTIFFGGALVAPFWEETMFRGLLFPALRRISSSPIVAALTSSLLFAAIHPQGPVLWAALASVALFSCVLAQKTRSLVPSVTMHFAHNATLLTLALLLRHS